MTTSMSMESLNVFKSLDSFPKDKVVFDYREVTSYLSEYILTHQNELFDQRCIKVANIEHSPLSLAFDGIKLFHRTQITSLLRKQLIPIKPLTQCIFLGFQM